MFPALGFFLGLLTLSIIYTVATECDTYGFSIFATILGVILFWKSIVLAATCWQLVLICAAAYVLIGGAWSVFRWFKYCREYIATHPYKEANERYEYRDGKEIPLTPQAYYKKKLQPNEHKSRLIGWVAYWPWSLIWNIAGDTLTAIYDALANVYQKVADAVIKKALNN